MARRFIAAEELQVSYVDGFRLNAKLLSGESFENLEAHRLFPVTGETDYISFADENREEKFILVGMKRLPDDQKELINQVLSEYYRIPRIKKILAVKRAPTIWIWDVETDRGPCKIEMTNVTNGIKEYFDGRLLFHDRKDNRFEVPDYRKLDKHSLSLLHLIF